MRKGPNHNMQEVSRIILGLRTAGWDDKAIDDFLMEHPECDRFNTDGQMLIALENASDFTEVDLPEGEEES